MLGEKVGRRAMPIRACAMYDTSSPSILAPRRTRMDYHGAGTAGTVGTVGRERNLLALPTLDMYLPLSKFESIHRVYIALRCNHNLL